MTSSADEVQLLYTSAQQSDGYTYLGSGIWAVMACITKQIPRSVGPAIPREGPIGDHSPLVSPPTTNFLAHLVGIRCTPPACHVTLAIDVSLGRRFMQVLLCLQLNEERVLGLNPF